MCQGAERMMKAKVHTLRLEFESMCMKDSEQLDHFYLRLNGLVTNIRALREEMKEAYVLRAHAHRGRMAEMRTRDLKEVIKWPRPMKMRNQLFSWKSPERKVKVMITDRGGEFGSNEFKKFNEKDGLTRHYTAPYTPQQNGVMECRNRTVVEMAKICLKEMKLPSFMWGEAVRHSVYLLNKLPMRALSGITPYEAWNEKKPQVGFIKVFGSISYMRIPSQKMSKLDDRSKPMVNLGKEPGTKAYRLYDPNSNKVFVSRDVIFDENNSWSWEINDVSEASMFIIEGMAEAAKDINWKLAMKKEMQSIKENQNWKLSKLPPGKKVIGLKWIFKLKNDVEGRIVKHKARLIPKGYVQERVVDFDEVFAPVTRPEMVHFLLALVAKNELEVRHLDVPEIKATIQFDLIVDDEAPLNLTWRKGPVPEIRVHYHFLHLVTRTRIVGTGGDEVCRWRDAVCYRGWRFGGGQKLVDDNGKVEKLEKISKGVHVEKAVEEAKVQKVAKNDEKKSEK
ncbi:hypothetical protein AgCh_025575 [Apium graveolens]